MQPKPCDVLTRFEAVLKKRAVPVSRREPRSQRFVGQRFPAESDTPHARLEGVKHRKKLKNLFNASDRTFLSIVRDEALVCVKQMSIAAFLTVLDVLHDHRNAEGFDRNSSSQAHTFAPPRHVLHARLPLCFLGISRPSTRKLLEYLSHA